MKAKAKERDSSKASVKIVNSRALQSINDLKSKAFKGNKGDNSARRMIYKIRKSLPSMKMDDFFSSKKSFY